MVSALVCMLALCSCGNKTGEDDYNGYTSGDLQSACEQTAEVLEGLTQEEAEQYYTYYASQDGGEIYADLIEEWIEIEPEIGEFVGYKDFEVTKSGKTLSATETISFSQRDVTLTYVMNANTMEVTAISVQIVYTLGETMGKAALNTIMGISIVFAILVLICLIIYCFRFIPVIMDKFSGQEKSQEPAKAVIPVAAITEDVQDDLELIAVIAAAIAMETGASTDDFVVRSIKRRY